VVENYSMTSYQEEGFFRLFEAFTLMGLKQESMLYLGKLKQSYPNSSWLIEAENIKSF
jgi:outer membrane protein assembly factor BamD (BamD/ComL family)